MNREKQMWEEIDKEIDKVIEKNERIENERWEIAKVMSENFHINGESWDDSCFEWTALCLQMEGYRKQSEGEWISVYDRLPEAGKLVLCVWERGDDKQNYGFGRYQAHDVWYVSNEGMPCVTNWMPLPELPKMEGGEGE